MAHFVIQAYREGTLRRLEGGRATLYTWSMDGDALATQELPSVVLQRG